MIVAQAQINFFYYSGTVTSFTTLCEQYFTCLKKEPSFIQYLDKIGRLYFNSSPSQTSDRGLFDSFLQSFFHSTEEETFNGDNASLTYTMVDLD